MDFTLATQIQCCREINGQTHSMEKIEGHKSISISTIHKLKITFKYSNVLKTTQKSGRPCGARAFDELRR